MTLADPRRRPRLAGGRRPPSTACRRSRSRRWSSRRAATSTGISPILKQQLRGKFGDLVAVPRDEAEVIKVARLCVERKIPLTVRGAGTGNYGQAMPLEGGIILETTALDRIVSLDRGMLTVGAGKKLIDLEAETVPRGWELRWHPSTRRTATIGGFVAGGSTGIGAIKPRPVAGSGQRPCRLKVVTLEDEPRVLETPRERRRRAEGDPCLWLQRHHHRADGADGAGPALGGRHGRLPGRVRGGDGFLRRAGGQRRHRKRKLISPIERAGPAGLLQGARPDAERGRGGRACA